MYYKAVYLCYLQMLQNFQARKWRWGKGILKVLQVSFLPTKVHFPPWLFSCHKNLIKFILLLSFLDRWYSVQSCFGRPFSMGNCSSLDQQARLASLGNKSTRQSNLFLILQNKKYCSKIWAACYKSRIGPEATSYITLTSGASIPNALVPTWERA